MNTLLGNIKWSFLATILVACMLMSSCDIAKKTSGPSYSYKKSKPKFMNGITMGGNGHKAINLDDVVQEEDEEDDDNVMQPVVATTNNNNKIATNATPSPHRKSNIKVTYEEPEPLGLQQPVNNTVVKKTTTPVKTKTAKIAKSIKKTVNTPVIKPDVVPAQPTVIPADVVATNTKNSESFTFANLQEKYAYMLGVLPQTLCNLSLYQFIEEWYGVRYHLGGTDKSGIDCSAFVQKLYEHVFGTNLLRTAIEQFANSDFTKKAKDLKEGDLVFFRIHSRRITHVGIYLANNFFIHASRSQGVTISNLNDSYWRKYYAGSGKLKS